MRRHTKEPGELYAASGQCYVCEGTKDLVNTEQIIPEEGLLLLCRTCVVSAARALKFRLWTPELEAELERAKLRARDAEAYQKIAEDAVIGIHDAAESVFKRQADEAEETRRRNDGRNSRGQFVKPDVFETSNVG
jgi:hypothetical protein